MASRVPVFHCPWSSFGPYRVAGHWVASMPGSLPIRWSDCGCWSWAVDLPAVKAAVCWEWVLCSGFATWSVFFLVYPGIYMDSLCNFLIDIRRNSKHWALYGHYSSSVHIHISRRLYLYICIIFKFISRNAVAIPRRRVFISSRTFFSRFRPPRSWIQCELNRRQIFWPTSLLLSLGIML